MFTTFSPSDQSNVLPVENTVGRVIVVGAGYSGIAAANALSNNGVDVIILEGRSRIGGRTHTVSLAGTKTEAGAGWIHSPQGNPLSQLAKASSVKTSSFGLHDIYANLQLVDCPGTILDRLKRDRIIDAVNAVEDELFKNFKQYPSSHTVAELLDAEIHNCEDKELSDWIKFIVLTGFEADLACSADEISVSNYAIDSGFSGKDEYVIGGYSNMLNIMAAGLTIVKNTVVSKVLQTPTGVEITCSNGRVECGSHVILSVPLGVLKAELIEFTPPLSPEKKKAISQLGFGGFEKLIFVFEKAFWQSAKQDIKGILLKGDPLLPYWIDVSVTNGKPTLVAHVTGHRALEMNRLSDEAVLEKAMFALSNVYKDMPDHPSEWYRTHWAQDPMSRGAYTHITPGGSVEEINQLSMPEGRILFSGEATSAERFGYVDGAYLSGLREAQRLTGGDPVAIFLNTTE
ncbi:flavin monoamine oxidase family protein [Dryocola sp. BD626]|uniref:flavin monoamine oxidase family protein n=1 Tax=Dryocola sp. BD626 TaxID=3133273 RepID=UPI003F4FD139